MIDTLVALREPLPRRSAPRPRSGLEPGAYVLVTLHRPALVDGPLLGRDGRAARRLCRRDAGRLPGPSAHARTTLDGGSTRAAGLHLLDPLGYLEFLSLEADAGAVLTDSGGVQEETTYLGVPCFTLRDNTERPVTVALGTNTLLGLDPAAIRQVAAARRTGGTPADRDMGRQGGRTGRDRGRRLPRFRIRDVLSP